MTDPSASTASQHAPTADAVHAGALLRAARQQQGLHIAALAASIKVSQAKLEALESGRVQDLPDATFTRALALTVCRVLKTDAAPVLALLPGAPPGSLDRVDSGLNTPFRERADRGDPAAWLPWRHPALWSAGVLLVAAAAFVLVPSQPGQLATLPVVGAVIAPLMPPSGAGGPAPVAEPVAVPAVWPGDAASAVVGIAPAKALPLADAAAPGPAAARSAVTASAAVAAASQASADAALVLRAVQATWVLAVDGKGQTLMARLVPAGETVALTPALPVRLKIGNVQGTELLFLGQPVNLSSASRDNIANITLP
ncbi:MAG: helix-turn-helix domain-containing protein [Aquabacterium sp.]|nr:helix-turn-helix domain-containing protein [Aquabacterium sp.]